MPRGSISSPQRCTLSEQGQRMTGTSSPEISASAERMRLHRERRRNGLRCVRIELRDAEISALVRQGLLKPETRSRPDAIVRALYGFLDRTLSRL